MEMVAFVSVVLSFCIYAVLLGPGLSAGLVMGMYVHELGHLFVLRRLGLPAPLPVFVPKPKRWSPSKCARAPSR